ncbi:hypothetical protein SFRURICE_003181 [Spodoptera frugiperda]|nr:hypothetical protein SFRURICE_003181 [Spodoptera frugiperda]
MAEKSSESSPSEPASTPRQEAQQSGNWWDTWISSAKSKSAEVYTMVKKDLDEIGTAVKSEASHVFSTTSTVIGKTLKLDVPESPANVMKKSLSSFIGQVSTVLNPEPDDDDDTEVILSSGDTTMLSTYKKELEALQRVDATFIVPAYSAEFEAWRGSLEASEAGLISLSAAARRLDASPTLKAQYDKLVPDAVSHDDFWERYLFRVALLQDRLAAAARKQPQEQPSTDPVLAHLPMQAAAPVVQSPKKVLSGLEDEKPFEAPDVDNVVTWEDEDFANDVELTEEQQTLLLEEYEREIAGKKTKQTCSRDIANNNTDKTTSTDNKKTKTAQTRDKMNNKTSNKNGRSPKKAAKSDVCGNNLVEDYFGDKEVKDDASANSDESWEKEFEIDDVVEQKA